MFDRDSLDCRCIGCLKMWLMCCRNGIGYIRMSSKCRRICEHVFKMVSDTSKRQNVVNMTSDTSKYSQHVVNKASDMAKCRQIYVGCITILSEWRRMHEEFVQLVADAWKVVKMCVVCVKESPKRMCEKMLEWCRMCDNWCRMQEQVIKMHVVCVEESSKRYRPCEKV